jgi:hypothetical protein
VTTSTPIINTTTSTTTSHSPTGTPQPSKPPVGAIVGGVIGGIALVVFAIVGICFLRMAGPYLRQLARGAAPEQDRGPVAEDRRPSYPIELHSPTSRTTSELPGVQIPNELAGRDDPSNTDE